MPQKSIRQALNEALAQEMRRDPTVVVIGEDVAGGAGTEGQRDAYGGVLGVTKGLIAEFGEARVIDTPITESAIMGAAAGAAVTGLRPVAELMFSDFFGVCFDQIFNQAAKFRYMFGGKAKTAACDPHDGRRRPQRGRPAFTKPLPHLYLGARAQMRRAVQCVRRQRLADPGDPR